MSGFKFKLQKVLDIKVQKEEEVKIKYVDAQSKKDKVENELKSLQTNYDKYSDINSISDVITQKITVSYLASISESIDRTNRDLEKKNKELIEAREELINKQIERKSLEKLKENKFSSYKKEMDFKEQTTN
ncbi:MAG: flagellar export protein FliJ, partial [Peptostreptococcaceae bacterium]